ncbi:type IV pilus assembly protein PilX [Dyella sp. OK004]|uniref:pilus assembly PilX family protein n=1 Tax=Dyella sp. OK004 TaxID=1855292 RepID=UPI0008E2B9ED|nr:PilX N-terminal domain-containing pilus assembly protein [Dyella sp. OK004]SFS19188.1 type IV pilus assembly protein PilX [Dyella sp. OK004]
MSKSYGTRVSHRSRQQRGVVLVVALIFLLLLTILAISASGHSLLQERMAGGLRNAQQAELAAETALRGAEWRLWKAGSDGSVNCGTTVITDCYVHDPSSPITTVVAFRTKTGWVTDGATEYKGNSGDYDYTTLSSSTLKASEREVAVLAKNPLYIIEDLGPELPPGTGPSHESGVTSSTGTGPSNTGRHVYRITARATGGNENTVRMVESTFAAKGN